ncbi:unnamed protein product [Acanthoscelides obtectus]|uniref:Alpha-1,3/1,6-mannosyltransferase ALG2 n=1 Tax=Acanthoscelides obtectus TaxID=200917 RepID=A0A9P0LNJ0_ACAOB|nr:unnamed protein product [Acanthoscelides obtectus]CAK1663059.1 Alpha-1,3/1,6-mannosyltransferase ALG2 [Acanthoscelides obtectus]
MSSRRKLKIVFIHPDLGIGGAERLVLDLAGALTNEGHEVKFITNHFDKNHAFDELKNGEYPVKVYGDWLPRSICGFCQAICAYVRMIYLSIVYIFFAKHSENADLYITDLIPVANIFLKLANEKVIYYCHHPDLLASSPGGILKRCYRKPINWLEMKATAKADVILVNSEYTASVFRRTFPEISKSLKILYPTVANTYQQTVEALTEEKPIESLVPAIKSNVLNKVVFLSINRFHPAKRLELSIEAMHHLKNKLNREEWERTFLILAGGFDPLSKVNAHTYNELQALTKYRNLQDKVIFLKSPSDTLKAELLKSCTCLIYTPVNEHFGIVPLEAMTVKKPVIAVNSGGPRETVEHNVTGYLCEPLGENMAEYMAKFFKEDTRKMGQQGRKRLDETFSYDIFKKTLNEVIETLSEENKKND